MIDVKLILAEPEKVQASLKKRGLDLDLAPLLSDLKLRRELQTEVETKKAERNRLSASVPLIKKAGGDVTAIFDQVRAINKKTAAVEEKLKEISERVDAVLSALPNLPDDDLPAGGKENNVVITSYAGKMIASGKIKDHVALATSLGLIDYDRAAKIAGHGTWIYTGLGARLEWALLNFFIDEHLKDGYEFILPPHLLLETSGYVAGQFPKFAADVFSLEGVMPRRFLLPTAETALVNLHRNEILAEKDLPRKYFAYTPCYRKEAGAYRTEERGMIRGYQFNKIEMFQYTTAEGDEPAFRELVAKAVSLMEKLGLRFRLSQLAAGDVSAAMARTCDIEVYFPSIGIYKEVSSVSTAHEYQARRGLIRYREEKTGTIRYVHTLNGSGLATSRVFPAILEQFQQPDGSVVIPEVLRPYLGGLAIISPKKDAS